MTDNQQPSSEVLRSCKKCGKVKPLDDFPAYTAKGVRYWRHDCLRCRSTYAAAWARGEIVKAPEDPDNRTCRKCGETKPISEFGTIYTQKSHGRQYKSHTCLVCHRPKAAAKEMRRRAEKPDHYRALQRKWRSENLDRARAAKQGSHQRLKALVFEAYGGFICACCGETEPSMLNIDHVNNDGAEHRKSLGLNPGGKGAKGSFYHWLRDNGFPSGYQVLCYNCNISKHRNKGVCAHELRRRFND